ncbi:PREDICTED: putative nuclease HARBI1 [Vollenhovia emeryi]|uniref:putative nuclease HARBI1 n=1 Tax=Vollenhovia emeryi TaxID=411798 RepID=UPI0005F3A77C|nr:PREDICTED: putative nuclease HARBI1 [Vollenhovia emeryi]
MGAANQIAGQLWEQPIRAQLPPPLPLTTPPATPLAPLCDVTSRSLTPINQLLLTLRFYATGNFLRACGDFSGVSISTASRVIAKVSMTIASLSATRINMPESNEEIRTMQRAFYEMYKFPRVIGCINGTHIRIQSPGGEHAEEFRNRKGYFSLNTQVVCDHKMRIIDIVARWPGSVHDATIFQHSRLHRKLEEGTFNSGILLGDGGYPVKKYLLTPLLHPTTAAENLYNNAHIRTRNIVERVFGVWKRRFPVLSLGMRVKMETVQDIIVATAVLHNIARNHNEKEPPACCDLPNEEIGDNNENQLGIQVGDNNVRQALIDEYFSRLRN